MQTASRFIFRGAGWNSEQRRLTFSYETELTDGNIIPFVEIIEFPFSSTEDWSRLPEALLESLVQTLHIALGLSYWKAHCAPELVIAGLTAEQAAFWKKLYTLGMGEFYYRNNIDFRALATFPVDPHAAPAPTAVSVQEHCLLPIGGGKDSIVSMEMLKALGLEYDLYSFKTSRVQDQLADFIGKKPLIVERNIDQKLIELNKTGEVYNGHLPISSIYMFIGVFAAALKQSKYIVFSNERSANIGNVDYLGIQVNHQWSKSLEAELLIREYLARFVTPDIIPFSLLRPLDEIEIVRRFAEHPEYFGHFSSCNKNFVIASAQPTREDKAYWCGECPKCAFVFACLAAFVPKEKLVEIFDKNLFEDAKLVPLYRELLGLEAFKPFECVGTPEETSVAFARAHARGEYADTPVMQMFEKDVLPTLGNLSDLEKQSFSVGDLSTLPEPFRGAYAA